jgi:lysophospholipase L1-like esterase
MRRLWEQSSLYGNNVNAFAITGDCNSEHYLYLERIAGGLFDLAPFPYLSGTKDWFYPSFLRSSQAVNGGFSAASMFDVLWADPKQCRSSEGPFACELRVTRASIIFIALGTGDQFKWQEFEANYRAMIDYALKKGVLPVLVTKGDNLEDERNDSDAPAHYINGVIRRLGQEYDLPVLDLWAALQPMYHHGLLEEDGPDFHLSGEGTWVHILTTLQTLDVIRH